MSAIQKNFKVQNGLEVGTNLIIADAVNNKVGIATTAPQYTLHVNGGAYVSDNLGIGTTNPTAKLHLSAGTASASTAPLKFIAGSSLTTPEAGTLEYDGSVLYHTPSISDGRGVIPTASMFKLTSDQTGITTTLTGTNYFGSTSNISLVATGLYEIEIIGYFSKTIETTAVWNLVFNFAPTNYTVYYEMSPVNGIVSPPGTSTLLIGNSVIQTTTTTTYAVTTGLLTTGVNHYAKFKLFLQCGDFTTSMKINIFNGEVGGTITPLAGSYWKCTRLPNSNNGTYIT